MWRLLTPLYGSQPAAEFFAPDTTQRHIIGTTVTGVDPYWGFGEFIYGIASATQEMGSLTYEEVTGNGTLATPFKFGFHTDYPNTANLGRPISTAIYPMTINQFGWYQISGYMVLSASASVAADAAVGITAAGQVGVNTAGKQVLNYLNKFASTASVQKVGKLQNGTPKVELTSSNFGGWFQGVTLSGTGIPGSCTIASFDPDQRTLTMSLNASASGTVTITGTYTNFIVGLGSRPFGQGAIT